MDSSKAMANTAEASGPSTISVVVTTVTTPASLTTCESPANSDTTRRRVSPIKLVGLGGLERQNYCCGHWFPSSKSYHRHLAEKALLDLTHEMKLIEIGMLRCVHCSMWVHVDSMSGHLRKSHGIVKVNKTSSKIIHNNPAGERTGNNRDALKTATNFVIKVSGQSAVRTSNGEISNSNINTKTKSNTVKLVTTSSGNLYHKVHQFHHAGNPGMGKVIVHQSTSNSLPIVSVGPRIVMKSVGSRNVIPLGNARQILPLPSGSQAVPTATTTTTTSNINGITTVQITGGNMPPSCSMTQNTSVSRTVEAQEKIPKVNGQNLKLIKKIANIKSKNKLHDLQAADCNASSALSVCTKTKEKGKSLSSGETGALKPSQTKKSRKQVLKPNLPDMNCVAETPPFLNMKMKKRGRKRSVEPGVFSATETNGSSPTLNHKGYRRKLKEAPDNENYTPKASRQAPKGIRGGWRKKKRGPGRPRKIRLDETPDLSEIDTLFDEVDKEDLENEPVLKTKKEEENVPTVELDLFTLPSLNEQMSVLLTEPHNPNFKVYASMDAIFVGDSALGDVTNQIGYVTDANNVVYVNPGHFLFPNVEDLENFVPSPILTVKGSKVGFTPARQIWKLNPNKSLTPVVLRENKFVSVSTSKEASSCGVSSERMNVDEKESQVSSTMKLKGSEKVLKGLNSEANQNDNILHLKPLRIAKSDVRQNNEDIRRESIPSTSQIDAFGTAVLSPRGPILSDAAVITASPKLDDNKTQRRQSNSQDDCEKEDKKDITESLESLPLELAEENVSPVSNISSEQIKGTEKIHEPKVLYDMIASQDVELHDMKAQLELKETSFISSDVTESLKSPIPSKNFEEAAQEGEMSKFVSLCRLDSENSTKLERSVCVSPFRLEYDKLDSEASLELEKSCASPLKSENQLIVSDEVTEDAGSPLDCKSQSVLSPAIRVNSDTCTASIEKSEESFASYSPVPETTKITSEKILSIKRRRRSRTKSAETFMNSTVDSQKDVELGCNDKDIRYSRRKVRQLSDSSVILRENKLCEGDRLTISDLRDRLRMEHLPTRLRRQSGKEETEVKVNIKKTDNESLIDQDSYPVTPGNGEPYVCSSDNSATQSDSPEGETKSSLETFNKGTPSSLQGETESRAPEKIGRQRRRSSKLSESLNIEPLRVDVATDATVTIPSLEDDNEKCINERLMDQEKAETRSGRERHSSSKCLESMSVISHSPKRVSSPSDAEEQACTCQVDQPLIMKQQPVADVSENPPSISEISCVPLSELLEKSEGGTSPHKECKKSKGSKAEESLKVSLLRENELSPLREWHGRGAKLKAQVLIQDQQAGVIDSQIIPSSSDISTHSRDATVAANNSVWSSSPKKISCCETQVTPTSPQAKSPSIIKSPASPKVSKAPKSPRSVQDREWQARGAKLKAQVMISDQQRSVEEDSEDISSQASYGMTSPPAKKMKAESSPGTMRDIRTFFTVKKSPVQKTEDECLVSSLGLSQTEDMPVTCKKKTNRYSDAKNDIRSYLSTGASGKRKPLYSPQKSSPKIVKVEETSLVTSPKRSPKKQDVRAVLQLRKEFELLETRLPEMSDTSLPRASCDFDGFDRCSRQSGLRSKSLMRLVSLLSMKRWYHLGKFPLPVDQLCDWDDEMLTSMIFDSN